MIMAVVASMPSQKISHDVSMTWFIGRGASEARMMAMKIMKAERQSMLPRASLRRRLILTFQRRAMGMERTRSDV